MHFLLRYGISYPILYKAVPGLLHDMHPESTAFGLEFFEFALSQKDLRDDSSRRSLATLPDGSPAPWPEGFRNPPFYGDIVNQDMYPPEEVDAIPAGFRISLPTEKLAQLWSRMQ